MGNSLCANPLPIQSFAAGIVLSAYNVDVLKDMISVKES